jgi:hypothetical protein
MGFSVRAKGTFDVLGIVLHCVMIQSARQEWPFQASLAAFSYQAGIALLRGEFGQPYGVIDVSLEFLQWDSVFIRKVL